MKTLRVFLSLILFPSFAWCDPAYRSSGVVTSGTGVNVTPAEAAGCALNDIMIAFLHIESDTAVTPPSGWSNVFNGTTMMAECNTAAHDYRQMGFWIRRGASAPDLTWVFSSAFRAIVVSCYSGATQVGDPFSFGTFAVRDTTAAKTFPNVSGTTSSNNELLIWDGDSFQAPTAAVPPTSFTERLDFTTFFELADLIQASAGTTGTVTGASWAAGANDTASSMMVGLMPPAASSSGGVSTLPGTGSCLGLPGTGAVSVIP